MDRGVAPAVGAQRFRVLARDRRRLARQLEGEVAERADGWLEIGGAVVVQRVLG